MKWIFNDGGRANAGYKGTTGDCVCRAIAIATGKTYQEVYDELIEAKESLRQTKRVRGSHPRTGIYKQLSTSYLKKLGWTWYPTMKIGSGCHTHLKAEELPSGKIICRCSKHFVAVIDGVLNDIFDCSRGETRCVYGYYKKD